MIVKNAIAAGFAVMLPLISVTAAEARIVCSGSYQIVDGSPIATPYCEDGQLAKVAREHGASISGSAIRNSIAAKEAACDATAGDTRTMDACIESGASDRR